MAPARRGLNARFDRLDSNDSVAHDELKARYSALNGKVVRIGRDDLRVFCAPEGGPLDYKNFRDRVWARLKSFG